MARNCATRRCASGVNRFAGSLMVLPSHPTEIECKAYENGCNRSVCRCKRYNLTCKLSNTYANDQKSHAKCVISHHLHKNINRLRPIAPDREGYSLRGSSASRTRSPITLNATTVVKIARPGKSTSHHA